MIKNDFETLVGRLKVFAPRGETREKLIRLANEYEIRLNNLRHLLNTKKPSCPICKTNSNVTIIGNGKNGSKKLMCHNDHDGKEFRFSTFTSYEAFKVYKDFLTEAMTILTLCGGTQEGIAKYLNISKYMVELGVSAVTEYISSIKNDMKIESNEPIIIVYMDFSSSRVSKKAAIIMAKVADYIAYDINCEINYLTAWNFIKKIKERLVSKKNAKMIFVTDGEVAWINPIQRLFPSAIHIRQFHKKSCRALIYVHYKYYKATYTFRCLWDHVLDDGECSEKTKKMRLRRKSEIMDGRKLRKLSTKTELYKGVILWKGIVYEPRGVRRKKSKKSATPLGAIENDENVEDATSDREKIEEIKRRRRNVIAPEGVAPERIFKGDIKEGLKLSAIRHINSILIHIFGGIHITSNIAESLFHLKSALKMHRTVKIGTKLIEFVLFANVILKYKPREEIKQFFYNVFSTDNLTRAMIRRKHHITKTEEDKKKDIKNLIYNAYLKNFPVVIDYQDRFQHRTTRMIKPKTIEKDSYSGQMIIRAYCYLRQDERTFVLNRICDAIKCDKELAVVH